MSRHAQSGKTKFTIENATKTRIVLADTRIQILGSFQNIRICRCALLKSIWSQLYCSGGPHASQDRITSAYDRCKGNPRFRLAGNFGASVQLPRFICWVMLLGDELRKNKLLSCACANWKMPYWPPRCPGLGSWASYRAELRS